MNRNEETIHRFYKAFADRDYRGMQDCYAAHAVFSDPVFRRLDAAQVKSMWEMLLRSAGDIQVSHRQVQADETKGSADWDAVYTFSATGRRVHNRVHARFVFDSDGKIIEHRDQFSFHAWARQALGITGLLLGWTSFLRNKVHANAMNKLREFMNRGQKPDFR